MEIRTAIILVCTLTAASACAAAPRAVTTAAAKKPVPGYVPMPAGPRRPVISTTAQDPEGDAAETRLSNFITRLQTNRRDDAARFFSEKVTPQERQAFMEGRWPSRMVGNGHDPSVILFQPDLQIRTRNRYPDALRLDVTQRKKQAKPKKGGLGLTYMPVKMRRENGNWMVELHPYREDVPVRVSSPGKEYRERLKKAKAESPKADKAAPKGAAPAR